MTVIAGGLITLEFAAAGVKYAPGTVGQASYAARDADLIAYVQAATVVIEDIVGSPVLQVTVVQKFNGGTDQIILNDNVVSITSVVEAGSLLSAATDYIYDPQSKIILGGTQIYRRIFYPGRLALTVTYVTGFVTVPMAIQLATRELVRFWIQQGNQSQVPSYGDAVESAAFAPQGFAVPKRVIELLAPYRKLGGFA